MFLKISENWQKNTCVKVFFLIKLQAWGLQLRLKRDSACSFIKKKTLTQVFSCTFCENFKNTFFIAQHRSTASEYSNRIVYLYLSLWKLLHYLNTANYLEKRNIDIYQIRKVKNQTRKVISSFHVSICSNALKLYTLKTLLNKNHFYFFFLIFRYTKIPLSFRMPHYEQ